jgi:phosphate transport system substrate-binding protein
VQKLNANPAAFGIFGFSFLEANSDKIQGAKIEGTIPTFDNIADGSYQVSRPLFFYVKNQHVDTIPGMQEYVNEFVSDDAVGEEGYLADIGLIPAPEDEFEQLQETVASLKVMDAFTK